MEELLSVEFLERLTYFSGVLLRGAGVTIQVTIGALLIAIALGLVLAALKVSKIFGMRLLVDSYIEVFRNIPPLTQLFIIYFGLAYTGIRFDPIPAAIIGLGLNGAAYCSEIFRSGFAALHHGQREAALAAGLTPFQTMRFVIFPQAWQITLPPLGNYAIALLKDTAVVSAIAAPEIMYLARNLSTETFETPLIYLLAAILYFCMTFPMARTVDILERKRRSWQ